MAPKAPRTYTEAGVDVAGEAAALPLLISWARKTAGFRPGVGRSLLDIGYYANVLDLGMEKALAVGVDGVGTKLLVAQMTGCYDTVGIDCIAMNVNDVLCVGAEPIWFFDYLGVERLQPHIVDAIGKGLFEGARQANVSIPGGETAQVKELIRGHEDESGFDLVGMAIGLVKPDEVLVGADLAEGDVVLGLPSTGLHSNGYTLARKVFFETLGYDVDSHVPELGKTAGEELLTPTAIYVRQVLAVKESGVHIKALCHITGGGFLNLLRVARPVSWVLDQLPDPPAVFCLLEDAGLVPSAEMHTVFNMGVGFVAVVPPSEVNRAIEAFHLAGQPARIIGTIRDDSQRRVILPQRGLISGEGAFHAL